MTGFLPTLASRHGGEIDLLLTIVHSFIGIVLLGWSIYFVYVLIRFRRARQVRAEHGAARSHTAHAVEFTVFGVEVALLLFFSIPFFTRQVTALPDFGEEAVHVRVVAQQFQWNVHYAGADGVYGRVGLEHVDDVGNPVGLDPDDPAGADDIVRRGQLVVPVNRPVVVSLSSKDVVHSFALPELRVKQDAIPGMEIRVAFEPTMTTAQFRELKGDPQREFEIMCAQLCGQGHFSMRGVLRVLEEEEFEAWLVENAPSTEDEEYDPFFD